MTSFHLDPATQNRVAWNAGKTVGTNRPLTQKQIWAISLFFDHEVRLPGRAMFDLATDKDTREAQDFRHCLELIIALRRPELAHLTFDSKKLEVAKEGFSISMIEKTQAGDNHRCLKSSPLCELP